MPAEFPNLYEQARQKYPRLPENIGYVENFGGGQGMLEFWPPDEPGGPDSARPSALPLGKMGVEVRDPKTRPEDVAADIVSHHMIDSDPRVSQAYRKLLMSMNSQQQQRLTQQYDYARRYHGEDRPFQQWAERTGQPGWLRGYLFGQWKDPERIYTPEQMRMLDELKSYLQGR